MKEFFNKLLGSGLSSKRLIGLIGSLSLIIEMFINKDTTPVLVLTLFALGFKTVEKINLLKPNI